VCPSVEPDFFVLDLKSADMILLTTDGLTRYADAKQARAPYIYALKPGRNLSRADRDSPRRRGGRQRDLYAVARLLTLGKQGRHKAT